MMWKVALVAIVIAAATRPADAQLRIAAEMGGPAEIRVTSYRDIPFRTVVRQEHDYSCGSAAFATLLTFHYGAPRTEAEVFQAMYEAGDKKRIQAQGFSLLEMKLYLDNQGYPSDGFRLTYDRLAGLDAPSIAMIDTGNYRHFVVVKGVANDRILVGDPMLGLRTYRRADFEKIWNGIAFLIRERGSEASYNDLHEWLPYAPTPWSATMATIRLDVSRDVPTPYQIAPVLNLDSILQ